MSGLPLVTVIAPVHNNTEDTVEFLDSLREVNYSNFRVIIVDDGSTDGTREMIKESYPEVILLEGDGNLWWSRAINWGIEESFKIKADYVLLIDNDCTVDRALLSVLVETARRNPRSMIASKVLYYQRPDVIWEAGGDINWFKGEYIPIGAGEPDRGQHDRERRVKCSTLVGTLIDINIFREMGTMDGRNFPMFKGDIDFTYRAYKKGYPIIYSPRSKVWHKVDATVRKTLPVTPSFISTLIYLTTHVRSPMNLKVTFKYYLRHSPAYMLPLLMARYCAGLVLKSLQHSPLYLDRQKLPFIWRKA